MRARACVRASAGVSDELEDAVGTPPQPTATAGCVRSPRVLYRLAPPPAPVLGGGGTRAQASCLPVHLLVMSVLVAVMCFRIFFRTVRTITISGIAPLWDRA